jgi:hypothetical protein
MIITVGKNIAASRDWKNARKQACIFWASRGAGDATPLSAAWRLGVKIVFMKLLAKAQSR